MLLAWLAGCSPSVAGGESPPKVPAAQKAKPAAAAEARVVLLPPGRDPVSVKVEVARTPAQQEHGLMDRMHLPEDSGMLFLFDHARPLRFWMHNTYIPLDMIFIESSMRVLGIVENAEPLTDSTRAVDGDSQFVLEVNAGFSRKHGLGKGTAVRFELNGQ